jgi:hypothetical protein
MACRNRVRHAELKMANSFDAELAFLLVVLSLVITVFFLRN